MGILIIFFSVSIVFSFLCSIWEAVILSVTPAYVSSSIQDGSRTGKLLQSYKKDIDRPLSAILTLNTIAHTVGAIGVGAQAGKVFGQNSIDLGITSISMESIIAGAMTLAILILSEIIPKTIGANMWRQLAPFTVNSLRVLLIILSPFVWLSQLITKSLKKDKNRSVFSRADFTALARAGAESGELASNESGIIQNLLKLHQLKASDIMTPRSVMVAEEESLSLDEFSKRYPALPYSRIPVYKGKVDNISGMVLKDDIYLNLANDKHKLLLQELKNDILHVDSKKPLSELFDAFIRRHIHIAVVINEFGMVEGLITMEDIFETLLGMEILDEKDNISDLQAHARQKWLEKAKDKGII